MTAEQILRVIGIYRDFFIREDIRPIDFPHDEILHNDRIGLAHCHGMLDKMVGFVQEGRLEKAQRWIGFIQGCLWMSHRFTLEALKDHSRPTEL